MAVSALVGFLRRIQLQDVANLPGRLSNPWKVTALQTGSHSWVISEACLFVPKVNVCDDDAPTSNPSNSFSHDPTAKPTLPSIILWTTPVASCIWLSDQATLSEDSTNLNFRHITKSKLPSWTVDVVSRKLLEQNVEGGIQQSWHCCYKF